MYIKLYYLIINVKIKNKDKLSLYEQYPQLL